LSLQEIIIRSEFDTTLINTFLHIAPDTISLDSILTELKFTLRPKSRTIREKHVQIRTEDEIVKSLEKNRFGLAEFFLLTMQNYDSAVAAYSNFIKESPENSELIPKAFHALDYIYSYKLQDSLRADSVEQIICQKYPDSEYANYIYKKQKKPVTKEIDDSYKKQFFQAESLLSDQKFYQAIDIYRQIAENDSGSIWAEKSRYAIAWIYEKELNDLPRAISAYTLITQEYPKGEIYNIAINKIKKPETVPETKIKIGADSTIVQETVNDSLLYQTPAVDSLGIEDKITVPDSTNKDVDILR
jgi:outer membrane protein assembly factor BamD (BamD/ComL family)